MKKPRLPWLAQIITTSLCLMVSVFFCQASSGNRGKSAEISRTVSFDDGWRFLKGNPPDTEKPGFDDSGWRTLDIPHDWSIEDLPGQNGVDIIGPFDRSAIDKGSSGYMVGGIGWYRKSFTISEEDRDKIAYLQFDGVCMRSDVWLNGKHLGFHPYGYTPFYYDITSYLNPPGQSNIVAVRVKNEGMNSRWYSGSGINRHVWLTLANSVHIDVLGGIYITTPVITENSAEVKVSTTLINSGKSEENIVLYTELLDPSGKVAATASSQFKSGIRSDYTGNSGYSGKDALSLVGR